MGPAPAPVSYVVVPSPFGELAVAWGDVGCRPKVFSVFLPEPRRSIAKRVRERFDGATLKSCPPIDRVATAIERCLIGGPVEFDLQVLHLPLCSPFQERVLRAEHGIPRGSVSTYGRVARHRGAPRAARAVGGALATNPFPIVIPCHRAIRTDGSLGRGTGEALG